MPDTNSTVLIERSGTAAEHFASEYVATPPSARAQSLMWSIECGEDALRMAGYSWRDIPFAELYDCFTVLLATPATQITFESASRTLPPRDTTRLEKALAYLRATPHRRANRDAENRKRMKAAVRLIEELEAVSPMAAPSDASVDLDRYVYGAS